MTTPNDNDRNERLLARLIGLAGPRPQPPQSMRDAVRSATEQAWQRHLQRVRRRRLGLLALAATLTAVAVGVGIAVDVQREPPPWVAQVDRSVGRLELAHGEEWRPLEKSGRIAAGARLRTAAESGAGLLMSNGSSLRVSAETLLRLVTPLEISLEQGLIYIDSGPETPGDVVVRAGRATVREKGTQFAVHAASAGLGVSVREGSVSVAVADTTFEAGAGERLELMPSGAVRRGAISANDPQWQWALALAPSFDTDGRSLTEFLNWVSRETGRAVTFVTPAIQRAANGTMLHGSITGLDPDDALSAVMATTDFEYELVGTQIVIRSRGDRHRR